MGYQRSTLLLEWPEGSEFHGLEVRMRRLNIGRLVEVEAAADALTSDGALADRIRVMVDTLAEGLISWNLETEVPDEREEGATVVVPVPATRDGLAEQDFGLLGALLNRWATVAASVPLESLGLSTPGENSGPSSSEPASAPTPEEESWAPMLSQNQQPIGAPA